MSRIVPLEGFGRVEKEYITIIEDSTLNFDIVAYATEEELVAAQPKENTIGIVTTDTITSWIFNTTEPTEPTEGMVWIRTSTSGSITFNALKKNGIQVYPLSVQQMVNSVWVDKTAMNYQNGEWVDLWDGTIFDGDNQYESITGGWESIPLPNVALKVSPIADGLKLEQLTGGGTGVYKTKNKVSLNGYSSLYFTGIINRPDRYTSNLIGIKIFSEIGNDVNQNVVAEYFAPVKENNIFDNQPVLSIGSLNDSYYIALFIQSSDGKYIDLKKLRLK